MERLWLTRTEACTLLDRSDEHLRTAIEPRLSADAKKRLSTRGKPWIFYGPALVKADREHQAETNGGDPLLGSTASSPALERYRTARAESEEMTLAERRKQLVSIEVFRRFLADVAAKYRRFGEEMVTLHGNGTAAMLQRLQEECRRLVEGIFGSDGDGAESGAVVGGTADAKDSAAPQ